jgi:hypothetical protein
MKNLIRILVSLTIAFSGMLAVGQTYHPLPTESAYWTVYEFDEFQYVYDDKVYTVEGDTLINGFEYTKVFQLNDYPTIYDTLKILHCFMRQDIEAKKIWFIRHYLGEDKEKLGYDLSVSVGDTVSLPAFDYGNIGDSIYVRFDCDETVILINGELKTRKQYSFVSTYSNVSNVQQYIEGISNVLSTFPNKYFQFDPFHQTFTMCMHLNGAYTWPVNTTPIDSSQCGFNLINIDERNVDVFNLYPNPAKNYLTIEIPDNMYVSELCLFDILGNSIDCSPISAEENQYVLNISHLPSGVYVIKLRSDTFTYYNKLIIYH